jgi:hypothetical protein
MWINLNLPEKKHEMMRLTEVNEDLEDNIENIDILEKNLKIQNFDVDQVKTLFRNTSNSLQKSTANKYIIHHCVDSPKFNLKDQDISNIDEISEFLEFHNLSFDDDDYEGEEIEDEEDLEKDCDFSEKEMLENVSALPLKLLNINNLDYVQLRDMIKRESKKRKSTKRKTKRKIGNLDTETIAIKEYLNYRFLQETKKLRSEKIDSNLSEKPKLDKNLNKYENENNHLNDKKIYDQTDEIKRVVLSDQTHNLDLNTNDQTIIRNNTNLQSSFVNIDASSLSEPKNTIKPSIVSQKREERCSIF